MAITHERKRWRTYQGLFDPGASSSSMKPASRLMWRC
ncbi:hypothetical protein J2Y55_001351 [Bosea sp. BE125]|nr:hypothetical protein [Bosea sp. BE125]